VVQSAPASLPKSAKGTQYALWNLQYWGHEVVHDFRRLILHLVGGVGVGAQGEACVVVAQHAGDGLHVYAILECQRREDVAKLMEAENGAYPAEAENKI